MPLQYVVRPTLDAPELAFERERVVDAIMLLERLLREHERYQRAFTSKDRKAHGSMMRKMHLKRVALAIGVRMPGHPHVVHEFVA